MHTTTTLATLAGLSLFAYFDLSPRVLRWPLLIEAYWVASPPGPHHGPTRWSVIMAAFGLGTALAGLACAINSDSLSAGPNEALAFILGFSTAGLGTRIWDQLERNRTHKQVKRRLSALRGIGAVVGFCFSLLLLR